MGLHKVDSSHQTLASVKVWLLPIMVVVVSGMLALGDDLAREWLRYDRDLIGSGQYWRLLTGHYVHLGASHFVLNATGLLLVWYLVGNQLSTMRWLIAGGASIVFIDLGFWVFEPNLTWYVGLSGLLHGILAAGIVASWNRDRPTASLLAVLVVGKLAYEQIFGPLPGSEASSGGSVVVAAHLYGAIGGAACAGLLLKLRQA
jgi:rhomboid family GlyGly-CTERM serine protease